MFDESKAEEAAKGTIKFITLICKWILISILKIVIWLSLLIGIWFGCYTLYDNYQNQQRCRTLENLDYPMSLSDFNFLRNGSCGIVLETDTACQAWQKVSQKGRVIEADLFNAMPTDCEIKK